MLFPLESFSGATHESYSLCNNHRHPGVGRKGQREKGKGRARLRSVLDLDNIIRMGRWKKLGVCGGVVVGRHVWGRAGHR